MIRILQLLILLTIALLGFNNGMNASSKSMERLSFDIGDTVILKSDTSSIDVKWYYSLDSITWDSIALENDSILIFTESSYMKAGKVINNCEVFSEVKYFQTIPLKVYLDNTPQFIKSQENSRIETFEDTFDIQGDTMLFPSTLDPCPKLFVDTNLVMMGFQEFFNDSLGTEITYETTAKAIFYHMFNLGLYTDSRIDFLLQQLVNHPHYESYLGFIKNNIDSLNDITSLSSDCIHLMADIYKEIRNSELSTKSTSVSNLPFVVTFSENGTISYKRQGEHLVDYGINVFWYDDTNHRTNQEILDKTIRTRREVLGFEPLDYTRLVYQDIIYGRERDRNLPTEFLAESIYGWKLPENKSYVFPSEGKFLITVSPGAYKKEGFSSTYIDYHYGQSLYKYKQFRNLMAILGLDYKIILKLSGSECTEAVVNQLFGSIEDLIVLLDDPNTEAMFNFIIERSEKLSEILLKCGKHKHYLSVKASLSQALKIINLVRKAEEILNIYPCHRDFLNSPDLVSYHKEYWDAKCYGTLHMESLTSESLHLSGLNENKELEIEVKVTEDEEVHNWDGEDISTQILKSVPSGVPVNFTTQFEYDPVNIYDNGSFYNKKTIKKFTDDEGVVKAVWMLPETINKEVYSHAYIGYQDLSISEPNKPYRLSSEALEFNVKGGYQLKFLSDTSNLIGLKDYALNKDIELVVFGPNGNPVPNAEVVFSISKGCYNLKNCGEFETIVVSDESGVVKNKWVLGGYGENIMQVVLVNDITPLESTRVQLKAFGYRAEFQHMTSCEINDDSISSRYNGFQLVIKNFNGNEDEKSLLLENLPVLFTGSNGGEKIYYLNSDGELYVDNLFENKLSWVRLDLLNKGLTKSKIYGYYNTFNSVTVQIYRHTNGGTPNILSKFTVSLNDYSSTWDINTGYTKNFTYLFPPDITEIPLTLTVTSISGASTFYLKPLFDSSKFMLEQTGQNFGSGIFVWIGETKSIQAKIIRISNKICK